MARDLIGNRIKALREARGWSQDDVARMLGFNDRQTVSTIETGTRRVTAQELLLATEQLGDAIGVFHRPVPLWTGKGGSRGARAGCLRNVSLSTRGRRVDGSGRTGCWRAMWGGRHV